jgi:hypothetical protein
VRGVRFTGRCESAIDAHSSHILQKAIAESIRMKSAALRLHTIISVNTAALLKVNGVGPVSSVKCLREVMCEAFPTSLSQSSDRFWGPTEPSIHHRHMSENFDGFSETLHLKIGERSIDK